MLPTIFILLIFRGTFGGGGMQKWIQNLCSTGKKLRLHAPSYVIIIALWPIQLNGLMPV